MVFSSSVFLFIFLPLVFVTNYLFRNKCSNWILLISSLIFYAWGEPIFVALMIISIAINWITGICIDNSEGVARKTGLIAGIVLNLSLLGFFKYMGFTLSTLNSIIGKEIFSFSDFSLPIGISFFTFQAISYICDVYKGDTKASKKIENVALYISFFPQLIAGPIVKYKDINVQIESRTISSEKVAEGFKKFIYGLGKKVLIANSLGLCVDKIFSADISMIGGNLAWIAAITYTFQIYYDFSGYSDMAIGLGKIFGFDILPNFKYPYLSKSITEFWQRWHISLGSWFREYVYIPLGGNRKGKYRTYLNLFIVFLLTGIWHGAAFTFIVWGIYHGFFSIIERAGMKKLLDKSKILSRIYCMLVVIFGWVLFRADSLAMAAEYISKMLMPWHVSGVPTALFFTRKTLFFTLCAVFGMGVIPEKFTSKYKNSVPEAIYCILILVLSIASIASGTYNPFIYFQF